ncbi:MAG: hypothetical protein Q4P13_09145 [Psychrobacter sp.]|nr:hypothetical protein [Psychrobacter sp.]
MSDKPKVTGYRQLTDEQVVLMNKIKAKGNEIGTLVDELRCTDELDQRSVSTGATQLQTGFNVADSRCCPTR